MIDSFVGDATKLSERGKTWVSRRFSSIPRKNGAEKRHGGKKRWQGQGTVEGVTRNGVPRHGVGPGPVFGVGARTVGIRAWPN